MIIRSPEPEVKIVVDRNPIKTSFEEWARPGHFSRTIAKGPDTTTWIDPIKNFIISLLSKFRKSFDFVHFRRYLIRINATNTI